MRRQRGEGFADRRDAGRRVAEACRGRLGPDPVVLGLPRGGVPVAAEVARDLDAPLDVLVVRKVSDRFAPEFALAAVGEGGVLVRNDDALARLRISNEDLERLASSEREVVAARVEELRGGGQAVPLRGRDLVVVDDGVATGMTAVAAVDVAWAYDPASVRVAVPVASPRAVERLQDRCDDVIVVVVPDRLGAVGEFYADFSATTLGEVREILAARDDTGRL